MSQKRKTRHLSLLCRAPLGDTRLDMLCLVDHDGEGIGISLSRLRVSLDDAIERSEPRLLNLPALSQVGIELRPVAELESAGDAQRSLESHA